MHPGRRLLAALLVATGLLASPAQAAESAGAGAPELASPYFPLVPGARWVYRERTGPFGSRRVVVTAQDTRAVRGLAVPLFVVREQGDRSYFGIEDSGLLGYLLDDGFVIRFSALGEDSRGDLRLFGEGGTRALPIQPRAGQSWEETTHLFVTPGSRGAPRSWSAEVTILDELRVPAGRYTEVARVVSHYWDPSLSDGKPQITYEDYYASGVGLIRSVTRNHEAGLWKTIRRELLEFDLPERAGD